MIQEISMNLDLFAGLEAKEKGMHLAETNKSDLVNRVRYHLMLVARGRGNRCVCIDDCAAFLESEGRTLGNAAGSVFKDGNWQFTGAYVQSKRVSNRGRDVKVWRLK